MVTIKVTSGLSLFSELETCGDPSNWSTSSQIDEFDEFNEITTTPFNISDLKNVSLKKPEDELYVTDEVAGWIWKISPPILLTIGLCGNFGIVAVMIKMKFWRKITYLFLFILAISDTVVLCVGSIREWVFEVFDYDIRDASDFSCKFFVFLIYFSMHFSSWTLVCVTFERFMKTRDPFRDYCLDINVPKILKAVYISLIVVTIGLDIPLIVMNGLVITPSGPVCNNTSDDYFIYEETYFVYLDLVWLSFLPFALMLLMNYFVGKTIRNSVRRNERFIPDPRNRSRHMKANRRLTLMLFWTSIYFLIATLPISIHFIVDTHIAKTTTPSAKSLSSLRLSKAVLYVLQFSNYTVNFYIYIKIKPSFRKTFQSLCKRSLRPQRTLTQTSRSTRITTKTDFTTLSNSCSASGKDVHSVVEQSNEDERHFSTNAICQSFKNYSYDSNEPDIDEILDESIVKAEKEKKKDIQMPLSGIASLSALVSGITVESAFNSNCSPTTHPLQHDFKNDAAYDNTNPDKEDFLQNVISDKEVEKDTDRNIRQPLSEIASLTSIVSRTKVDSPIYLPQANATDAQSQQESMDARMLEVC